MTQAGEDALGRDIRDLVVEVKGLRSSFKRVRNTNRVQAVMIVAMLILGVLFYLDTVDRRQAISNLACFAVRLHPNSYSGTVAAIRRQYHCPPFDPSDVPTPTAGPTATATATTTVIVPGKPGATRTVAVPTPQPGATRTVTAPGAVRTQTVPGRVRTVTRTVTRTATVTVSPSRCVLPPVCLP